jgi:primosomal protein N' (replication factor Y)
MSEREELANEAGVLLKEQIELEEIPKLIRIGPSDCTIAKINDIYKKVLYVKHYEYEKLVQVKNKLEKYIEKNEKYKNVSVQFDFNPMNTY